MKKLSIIICVLVLAICAFSACGTVSGDQDDAASGLAEIAALMDADYSSYTLEVKTQKGGAELISTFAVKYTADGYTVDYSLESLNEISLNGANQYKTVKSGKATVTENGTKVTVDGESVDVDFKNLQTAGLAFKNENLKNVKINNGELTADVSAPSAFIGSEIAAESMTVKATFAQKMQSVVITYTLSGANVTYTYTFA